MTDREKVIKGLECCTKVIVTYEARCTDCPYYDGNSKHCIEQTQRDALELLKEREARELTKEEWEAWKKSPRRDPICMVYHQDTTPIWVLDPTAVNEVLYYMGKIMLFTNKPERKQVKWDE